ncbi:MAG: hypothetical protein JW947_04515 [Sedimentisphaerales bacterium]|nr:hypothetical protein [Sedimentisphaerales bacterium]
MNKKQFITMWCGIAAIVLAGLTVIEYYGLVCFYGFSVWVFIVALVAGGLIYTFKDKAGRKLKNEIQDIRGNLLKKKRYIMDKNDFNKDKQPVFSENHIL